MEWPEELGWYLAQRCLTDDNGCWLWKGALNTAGYGTFGWQKKTYMSHRVAWEYYKGEIPKGLLVLHECDVRACFNPEHLFLGTHQDNIDDMYKKGRQPKGRLTRKGRADTPITSIRRPKLNSSQIIWIRRMHEEFRDVDIAAFFQVSPAHIHCITTRKIYTEDEQGNPI